MVLRSLAVCALLACLGVLTPLVPAATAASDPAATTRPVGAPTSAAPYDAPLLVEIDDLSPGYLPEQGEMTLTGTVTNADELVWTSIRLYPFFGARAPMITRGELVAAGEADPLLEVGSRITDVSAEVERLAPGASAAFSISVPADLLDTAGAGVYWFGVHAMGQSDEQPRDLVADGRARTLLPYVPQAARDSQRVAGRIKTALVVPLRRYLPFAADGSLDRVAQWERALGPQGRLRSLVDFGAAADGSPISWLVDPALLDAVARLAAGNPARSLSPTRPAEGEGPDDDTDGDDTDGDDTDETSPEADRLAAAARGWLATTQRVLEGQEVLALPYGDVDVEAAVEDDPDLYRFARERPGAVLAGWNVAPRPAISTPGSYFDPRALPLLDALDDSPLLMTDEMFGDDPPGVAEVDGRKVGVVSSGVSEGGTAPGNRHSSLQVRQRILSEAAVRLLSDGRHPLVALAPRQWRGEAPGPFLRALEAAPWLDLTTYADATSRDGRTVAASELHYPEELREQRVPRARFHAATELMQAGESLQSLLTRNDEVAAEVAAQALTAPSLGSRFAPHHAGRSVVASRDLIRQQLRGVTIDAGPGVTLSSSDGGFAAVVTNHLDEPVTVQVRARAGNGIEVAEPEPVQLRANGRTTVVLEVHARTVGVHRVSLVLTDLDGSSIGSGDVVPIRSSQVSGVIWLIVGVGCGLLLLAILVRLVRRVRRARRRAREGTPDDPPDDVPSVSGDTPPRAVEPSP